MSPQGEIFYVDEYQAQYKVTWNTKNNIIDMTTYILDPFTYTDEQEAKTVNRVLFRKGVITVIRQAFKPTSDGYIIIAEGSEQYVDFIQMNYPCGGGPTDKFLHHFNSSVADDALIKISDGSRWADPDDPDDEYAIWTDIDSSGVAIPYVVTGATVAPLEYVDIWSN